MTRRYLGLMTAPVSPSNGQTVEHNIAVAKDWYPFLRELTADMPITIVCPWLVGILLGDEDSDPAQRERAMVDSETGAARYDLTIAVGEALTLTTGMAREDRACPGPCVDLLDLGREYEHPQRMGFDRREDIRDRIRQALLEVPRLQRGDVVQVIAPAADGSTALVGSLAFVLDDHEVRPDAPPDGGGVPVLFHAHDSATWARVARDKLAHAGRAALVPMHDGSTPPFPGGAGTQATEVQLARLDAEPTNRETQRSISDWANATFGAASSNARVAARSNEEMAELLRALTNDDNHPGARLESADVVIVLYRLAERMGFDLGEAIDEKMRINRGREWKLTGDGHGQHVREDKQ